MSRELVPPASRLPAVPPAAGQARGISRRDKQAGSRGTREDILFVTGFWSAETLARSSTRATESYLRLFQELHQAVPFAMHVWIEPHLERRVRAIVVENAPAPRTVRVKRYQDLPFTHLVARCESLPHMDNVDRHGKESIPFSTTSWAKAALVDEAARLHGIAGDSARVAWIDFGIAHVADMAVRWAEVEGALRRADGLLICEMHPTAPNELDDLAEYCRFNRGRVAAGFFSGAPTAMTWFADATARAIDEVLDLGRVVLEEQVMSVLCAREPDRFAPYSSDYMGVLRNVTGIERDLGTVLYALGKAREKSLSQRGLQIFSDMVDSASRSRIRLEPHEAARLLYDAFICAWYVDRARADDVAELAVSLRAAGCAEVRREIDRHRKSFDSNLAFAGAKFDGADPVASLRRIVERSDFPAWKGCL